jgi:hypothetical protein
MKGQNFIMSQIPLWEKVSAIVLKVCYHFPEELVGLN